VKDVFVITQCRLSSARLKNKIILPLNSSSVLNFLLKRLKKIKCEKVICAIADEPGKNKIIKIAKKAKVNYRVGSRDNVLERIYNTAKHFKAKIIIRITSDCPLVDPDLVNSGLKLFLKGKYDYLSNNLIPSWPHGLDFEIFTFKCLERNYKNSKNSKNNKDIEHVTYSIRRNKKIRRKNIICPEKLDRYYRWTLDTPKDYLFIKKLLKKTKKTINPLNWKKILLFLKKNKNIQNINGSDHHFYF
jgi:spore coat polysaccharide biosynthesis protein SpsF